MGGIFISYRREDSAGHSGRLFDHLSEQFGKNRVFMDVAGIEPGVDFVESIDRAVGSCDVLISVIGKKWLDCTDPTGRRRLDDQNDFIRIETATALKRNIRVIPVLVQGAAMPTKESLPDDLKSLSKRQSVELSDTRWNSDVNQLVETLARTFAKNKPDAPKPAKEPLTRLSAGQMTAIIVAALILTLGGMAVWMSMGHKGGETRPAPVSEMKPAVAGQVEPVATQPDSVPRQTGPRDEILGRLSRDQWKGLEMLEQGKPNALEKIDQTLREAEEATKAFPDDARFHEVKGYLLKDVYQCPTSKRLLSDARRLEYLNAARESAGRALRLAPKSASAHNLMGNVLYFEGNCDAAVREYDLALRLNDNKGYESVISGDRQAAVQGRDSGRCFGR